MHLVPSKQSVAFRGALRGAAAARSMRLRSNIIVASMSTLFAAALGGSRRVVQDDSMYLTLKDVAQLRPPGVTLVCVEHL